MDRYNKCQTKRYTRTHTHCTHISWWSVLGWVTTKEDHPLLWFDAQSIEIWSVNKYISYHYHISRSVLFCFCQFRPVNLGKTKITKSINGRQLPDVDYWRFDKSVNKKWVVVVCHLSVVYNLSDSNFIRIQLLKPSTKVHVRRKPPVMPA